MPSSVSLTLNASNYVIFYVYRINCDDQRTGMPKKQYKTSMHIQCHCDQFTGKNFYERVFLGNDLQSK